MIKTLNQNLMETLIPLPNLCFQKILSYQIYRTTYLKNSSYPGQQMSEKNRQRLKRKI